MGRQAAGLLPELAEHVANESGWVVATGTFSGVGGSTGTFSASKWREDLATILDRVAEGERRVSLAGFGFGGSLALRAAAHDDRVRGVATFAAPAHLEGVERFARRDSSRGASRGRGRRSARICSSPRRSIEDLLAIDPMGAIAEIPPAPTPDRTRHRRHRSARL